MQPRVRDPLLSFGFHFFRQASQLYRRHRETEGWICIHQQFLVAIKLSTTQLYREMPRDLFNESHSACQRALAAYGVACPPRCFACFLVYLRTHLVLSDVKQRLDQGKFLVPLD